MRAERTKKSPAAAGSRWWLVSAIVLMLPARAAASQGLSGVVRDEAGTVVTGAQVVMSWQGTRRSALTDDDGRFAFSDVPVSRATLHVEAPGYESTRLAWDAARDGREVQCVLETLRFREHVVITARRTQSTIADTAASVTVLTARDVELGAAPTLDDDLRQVPGFTLFRRHGSRTANPTTQGVSLRGVGASGASRAAVLVDGLPLGDPFGGWIPWSRVPRAALRQVEVVRGGASHLYGTDALGGIIQLLTRTSAAPNVAASAASGSQGWRDLSAFAAGRRGIVGVSLAAEAASTDGYVLVGRDQRGPVDTAADSRHRTAELTLDLWAGREARAFLRGSVFSERRGNGTPLQSNRTYQRQVALGIDAPARAGTFRLRGLVASQVFDQTFSAVGVDRATESLVRRQRVPSQRADLDLQWSQSVGARLALVAGLVGRVLAGTTDEVGHFGGRPTSVTEAGGRVEAGSVFAQGTAALSSRTSFTLGLRADAWRLPQGRISTRSPADGADVSASTFPERDERAWSPHVSVLHRPGPRLSLFASAYRAFRAPTLNELYRPFRVGNVVTLANAELHAERLDGAEMGVGWESRDGRFDMRGTAFWARVAQPIANVTVEATAELITRQRQNLGRTRSPGIELELSGRPVSWLSFGAGYQWVDARVQRFPADRALEGRRLPQVAAHQGTFRVHAALPGRVTVTLQGRASGPQLDDDRNELALDGFVTFDAQVGVLLGRGVELFGAMENVSGTRIEVSRTPVTTYGPPRQARVGLRFDTNRR